MIAVSPPPPSHKRPRGLWKGRRDAALHASPEGGRHSHDPDELEHLASTSTNSAESYYDDDFDDDRSSHSSAKRRRLSGGLSDSETLWHHSPVSRSPTPDLIYNAPGFPSLQRSKFTSDFLNHTITTAAMQYQFSPDRYASINKELKGKQPSTSDIEDWENLKALFARASESYDCESFSVLLIGRTGCHRGRVGVAMGWAEWFWLWGCAEMDDLGDESPDDPLLPLALAMPSAAHHPACSSQSCRKLQEVCRGASSAWRAFRRSCLTVRRVSEQV